MAQGKNRCRIGIDVGGTFTDFVLANLDTGAITRYKEPSTPKDPSLSVQRGLKPLIERAKVKPEDVELIVHGTTLMVNAIIQRRGARVALVVTKGNRGVLEIGRASLPNSYDYTLMKEEPLTPRNLVFELPARTMADGKVVARPTTADYDALAKKIRDANIQAVTVMLLHSFSHPELEREVAAELGKRLADIPVIESASIWPERREYERAVIAVMNAYVRPLMDEYLNRLVSRVAETGVKAPIYITASNGGTLSIGTARERPVDTVFSGPASGVVAAMRVAAPAGHDKIGTVDIGGTSCDVAVAKGSEPEYTTRTFIGDFPIAMPVVNVSSIGAGGGSILWVDPQGVLKVGPHSAGGDPGPACYSRGGTQPTVTDCYLLVGYIDPANFLGGRMALDRTKSEKALEAIADKLGYTGPNRALLAAQAALRVATATMTTELFKDLARRGDDPREFSLMAFGGAGPTHANLLADEARLSGVIVPPAAATFCAMGAILADVKRDYVRSKSIRFSDGDKAMKELARIFRELEVESQKWITNEGDLLGKADFAASGEMRYAGQAFDIKVDIPEMLRKKPNAQRIAELFHVAHERMYSYRDEGSPVEMTTERVRITGRIPPIKLPTASGGKKASAHGKRRFFHDGKFIEVPVFLRSEVSLGQTIIGAAIIEQEDTTIIVLPGWQATIDTISNVVISRPGAKGKAKSSAKAKAKPSAKAKAKPAARKSAAKPSRKAGKAAKKRR
ncbi:MAG: hydantoinase/oxoprolinase family protein [Rhodospirillales bacterium]|nr:hydantoinase/oxoprolinase family protein [Rhodospirillales bacterium]